jgi:CheY-like chemotaxis protein
VRGLSRLVGVTTAHQRPRTLHPLRVLVVDDQELVLRCTVRLLSDFETVVAVRSPMKALEMLRNGGRFDVVVSDVMMPEMSGAELYVLCHALSPRTADRFIFASGDPGMARRLLASAVSHVGAARTPPLVDKPIPRNVLVAAVLAAAAYSAPKSGTYGASQSEGDELWVRKYRG